MNEKVPLEKMVCGGNNFEFDIKTKILRKIEKENLNSPMCILGFPGVADIGKIALDHLVKNLNAEKIMDITFSDYPAGAIINESLLYAPTAEVYFYKDPRKQHDLFLITADAQPMSPRGIYTISEFFARLMADYNVELILTMGGYPIERPNKKTNIFVTATSKQLLDDFAKNGRVQKIVKGVVVGPNGLVPTLAKRNYNIDGLVLLAETDGYAAMNSDSYDLKASLALIDLLNQELCLTLVSEYTHKQIEKMEVKLNNEKETIKQELGFNSNSSKTSLGYIC
ncbi:MAG: PAC2 family protein [Candidatus Helarchaeota archaeon]